jgi:hypothetical protein
MRPLSAQVSTTAPSAGAVRVATLPGTPQVASLLSLPRKALECYYELVCYGQQVELNRAFASRQEFPLSSDHLISLAKELFAADSGVTNPSLLAEDFRFEFPVVSLSRAVRILSMGS